MSSADFVKFSVAAFAVLAAALLTGNLFDRAAPGFFAVWFLFFYLDVASTARIYRRSRADFERIERNRIFVALTKRLSLPLAIFAFAALVELPTFAFISFVVAPAVSLYLIGSSTTLPCLMAAAGVLAFAHADGWRSWPVVKNPSLAEGACDGGGNESLD